jgi:hypothetical protein
MIYKNPKEDVTMKRMRVYGGLVIITGDATEGSVIIVYDQKITSY